MSFSSREKVIACLEQAIHDLDWDEHTGASLGVSTITHKKVTNASAAASSRGWRQWAGEACRGSAGAVRAFAKLGIDVGSAASASGPRLSDEQLATGLPLWMDGRRAAAKQLRDLTAGGAINC